MTVLTDELQTSDLRLAARAVYLATEEGPADDISRRLRWGADTVDRLQAEVERLLGWVNDLQAGMFINCVYCGHRYGPDDEVPATMADALKEHIEQCPKHPMSALRKRAEAAEAQEVALRGALEEVMTWIANWDAPFRYDAEWADEVDPRIRQALATDAGKRVMAEKEEGPDGDD